MKEVVSLLIAEGIVKKEVLLNKVEFWLSTDMISLNDYKETIKIIELFKD